jgi:DNA mismatch repair ATPase MutS
MKSIAWFIVLLCSCSPNSSEEFQREGKALCRLLVSDLQKIENREQLLVAESTLKKHFEMLIDLMIEAREFQQKKVEDVSQEVAMEENHAQALLEGELRRIYMIEGGREVIERTQQEALVRLDAYERALTKKRQQLKG